MQIPEHAPAWVKPMVAQLVAEGFEPSGERAGGMQGYVLLLTRDDLTVAVGADRGDWRLDILTPNPQRGRGYPRIVRTGLEVFVAAVRGDTTPDALFEDTAVEKAAKWLMSNVDVLSRMHREPQRWRDVRKLEKARAQRLFGNTAG